jgi:hypothetical protein
VSRHGGHARTALGIMWALVPLGFGAALVYFYASLPKAPSIMNEAQLASAAAVAALHVFALYGGARASDAAVRRAFDRAKASEQGRRPRWGPSERAL